MGRPVIHFEIVGADAARTQAYYRDLFGWESNADNPFGYGVVSRHGNTAADGAGIGGGLGGAAEGYVGHLTFYVEVPDVEEALRRAEELGGRRVMEPSDVLGGVLRIGRFADSDGHVVGVVQARP
ncbi:MAG TPA: VOC family protein [Frankiaceae bacterium]|nr:VOC family protein [Frankiaceae bacterium]